MTDELSDEARRQLEQLSLDTVKDHSNEYGWASGINMHGSECAVLGEVREAVIIAYRLGHKAGVEEQRPFVKFAAKLLDTWFQGDCASFEGCDIQELGRATGVLDYSENDDLCRPSKALTAAIRGDGE